VLVSPWAAAEPADTIQRVRPSIVAVGTYEKARSPAFAFSGTGFVVGDGSLVATNAHVLPLILDGERREVLVVAVTGPTPASAVQVRIAKTLVIDQEHDLALLRIEGLKMPALALGDPSRVREGQTYLFTGFPIGAVLGLVPVTHHAMVSALTPIAMPTNNAKDLDVRVIKRLANSQYLVIQLDATAYPGNSGSPLYDPETGQVLGIINMVFVKGSRETALTQPSGITYAVPVQALKDLLGNLKSP
jgi:S1-C subfamily serine protease